MRTAEALALVQPAGVNISKATLEAQLLSTGKARSQQKFLHPKSQDTKIQASLGGTHAISAA